VPIGKSPELITAEHLQHCHGLLPCVLAKLFNVVIHYGYVPRAFGLSYTVPIPKGSNNKSLTADDFRGISISPVLSKLFEHCVADRFETYFSTSDNQFGFKKSVGCSHAIYSARCVVNRYVSAGSTVNLCAMDISKAFDKMNHKGLFIKLMEKLFPLQLLIVFENWFEKCFSCVKWCSAMSSFYRLQCGIRQGGVLSPLFFAIYIDNIVKSVSSCKIGCYVGQFCTCIFLYADDILLLAPSVQCLQKLVLVCEGELNALGMSINDKKTVCMRIGPRYQSCCVNILTLSNKELQWVKTVRYLGIYIASSCKFKCVFDNAKKSFYRSFNAIYGRLGECASEETILFLINSKCMPILLYGLDACPIIVSDRKSLDFTITRILMKIFKTTSNDIIGECQAAFNFPSVHVRVRRRKQNFLYRYSVTDNYICKLFLEVVQLELAELNTKQPRT